jgi:hypothetical protein
MREDMNEWLQGMRDDLERILQEHVEREWHITEEVSGTGTLVTRARHRTHPIEIINGTMGVHELRLN